MNELPPGWVVAPLGNLLRSIEAGLNVKCEERPPLEGEAGLVKISAVTWGRFNEEASKTLPKDASINERNRIYSGDLLISRANTIELVGASVIVGPIRRRLYLSDKVLRLVVDEPAKRWINYALKTPQLRKAIQAASTGNQLSMRNIPQEKLRSLSIPLAPEAEQTRIADQLDTLLARIHACNDHLDAIPGILKRFRQAVMNLAASGALTEAWRNGAIERCAEWRTVALHEVITDMRNGLAQKPTERPPGTKILRIGAVRAGQVNFSDHRYLDVSAREAKQYELLKDDLLFTRYNGSLEFVGVCACIQKDALGYVYPDKLIRVRVRKDVIFPKIIEIIFASTPIRALVEGSVKSSAGQRGISGSDLKGIKFLLPSLPEQVEIIRQVELLLAIADRIESRYITMHARAQRLVPQVLAKAFRGELVEQDSQDEPASVLLQRLAASQPTKGASRGRPRSRPQAQPSAPDGQPADWVSLPNDAWAAPADPDGQAAAVWLTAVLRAWKEPMPERTARLASLLCQQPRLLTTVLPAAQAKLWSRLVGDEAQPLPANVARFQPATNSHWGRVIKGMRVRGDLIEAATGSEVTWTLGSGAASIETASWPDGRAGFVVAHLRAHGVESILPSLEPAVLEFVDARAA